MLKSIFFKIMSDEKQRQKINSLKEKNEIFELFCENGYRKSFDDFEKDMIDFLNSEDSKNLISNNFDELSDEMLEMIAGGVNAKQAVTAGIATLLTTFTIGAIGSQMLSQNNTAPPSSTDTVSISSSTQDDSNFSSNNDNQPANDNGGQNTNNNSNENKPNGTKTMNNRKSPGGGFRSNSPSRPGRPGGGFINNNLGRPGGPGGPGSGGPANYNIGPNGGSSGPVDHHRVGPHSGDVANQDKKAQLDKTLQQKRDQHNKYIEEIENANNANRKIVEEHERITKKRKNYAKKYKEIQNLLKEMDKLSPTNSKIENRITELKSNVNAFLQRYPSNISQEEASNHLKSANKLIKQMKNMLNEYKQQLIKACEQRKGMIQSLWTEITEITEINELNPNDANIQNYIMQVEAKVNNLLKADLSMISPEVLQNNYLNDANSLIQQTEYVLNEYKQPLIEACKQTHKPLQTLLTAIDKLNPNDEQIQSYIMQLESQVNEFLKINLSIQSPKKLRYNYLNDANSLIQQMQDVLNEYKQQQQQLIETCKQKHTKLQSLLKEINELNPNDEQIQSHIMQLESQVNGFVNIDLSSLSSEEAINHLDKANSTIQKMENMLNKHKQQLIHVCEQTHKEIQNLLKEINNLYPTGSGIPDNIVTLKRQGNAFLEEDPSKLSPKVLRYNYLNDANSLIQQMQDVLNEYKQQQQQLIETCKQKHTKLRDLLNEMDKLKSDGKIKPNDIMVLEFNVKALLERDPSSLPLEKLKNDYLRNANNLIRQMNNALKNK